MHLCVVLSYVVSLVTNYSVSQKNPPAVFRHFSPNGWEFLINFYTHITRSYTLDYKFLFTYLQL